MTTFQEENENSADNAKKLKVIQRCSHCGDETKVGNKFCNYCTYIKVRKEMCEENKSLNSKYTCVMCEIT